MKTGRVSRLIEDKGFGFITAEGIDYFFHHSQCITPFKELKFKDKVQFNIDDSPKGPRAKDVDRIA